MVSDTVIRGLRARRWMMALLAGGAMIAAGLPQAAMAQGAAVTLEQARAEHEGGRALLVDIREPDEHATGVAPGARLLPMRQLGRRIAELPRDRPVLLICNTQNRSRATYEALRERGYTNLRYVSGGMSEWVRRGWKVTPPIP
jgi:rhodanese-related sulfurtransferase